MKTACSRISIPAYLDVECFFIYLFSMNATKYERRISFDEANIKYSLANRNRNAILLSKKKKQNKCIYFSINAYFPISFNHT
jgi:hypothetical protein